VNRENPHRHRRNSVAYHNPLRIAEDYAMLDCLSRGRPEFGIGHRFIKWERALSERRSRCCASPSKKI
jgi:hypothetical protein